MERPGVETERRSGVKYGGVAKKWVDEQRPGEVEVAFWIGSRLRDRVEGGIYIVCLLETHAISEGPQKEWKMPQSFGIKPHPMQRRNNGMASYVVFFLNYNLLTVP